MAKQGSKTIKIKNNSCVLIRLSRHALPISLVILRKKPTVLQSTCSYLRDVFAKHGVVVVQFYPWFKFYFLLFLGMVMYDNEFET